MERRAFASILLIATAATDAHAQTTLRFREVTVHAPNELVQLQIDSLPALANPHLFALKANSNAIPITLEAANGDPFAPGNTSTFRYGGAISCEFLCNTFYGTGPGVFFAELLPNEAPPGSVLYVGTNADGLPPPAGLQCQASVKADTAAQCLISLPSVSDFGSRSYWVLVQAPQGAAGQQYSLTLRTGGGWQTTGAIEPTYITGPGHAGAGAALPLRLTPRYTGWNAGPSSRSYVAVSLDDLLVPVAVTSESGSNDLTTAFTPGYSQSFIQGPTSFFLRATRSVEPGETLRHIFFDIPPTTDGSSYGQVPIAVGISNFGGRAYTPGDLDVYLLRRDFPSQSASAVVEPAADTHGDAIHWDGQSQYMTVDLTSGRWYVVVSNFSKTHAALGVELGFGSYAPRLGVGANPTIAPGFYYNHQRSGHGIALSQAGGQQVVNWYTYLEDGTPQWYQAQATAPDPKSGWWQAPLYRVAWDGAKAHLTEVGDITLTPIATNEFMFTWDLEGQFGSERFAQLARTGDCPNFNGVTTNFTGAWYAPTLSGYGMDVLSLPEQQFNVFYFYDNLGLARWGVGNSLPFAANSTLAFTQNTGFCPNCAYAPVTRQPMGTVDVDYASASSGNLSTNLVLQPPLSGSWVTNKPMVRLTGSSTCTQ